MRREEWETSNIEHRTLNAEGQKGTSPALPGSLRVSPQLLLWAMTWTLFHEDRVVTIDRVRSLGFQRMSHSGWRIGGYLQHVHWHIVAH
jgi:hypothetical protein